MRRFTRSLEPIDTSDVLVNTTVSKIHADPYITALQNGGFVITWTSKDAGSHWNVYKKQYTKESVALDSVDVLVNIDSGLSNNLPYVISLKTGDYIIVWQHMFDHGESDGLRYDVVGKRYNIFGMQQESAFQINIHKTCNNRIWKRNYY